MPLWTDVAAYAGPTPNRSGAMLEQRGVVLHIAQGTYDGTIAWQRNPAAQVSSHFVVSETGLIAQMVDTDLTAWTQAAGNGRWVSIEFAGWSGNPLTDAQVAAAARLYARGVAAYGWPLAATDSPGGTGLGWHGMGGAAWGGHPDCPGDPIKNQRGAILARATQLTGGAAVAEPSNPKQFDIDAWRLDAITYGLDHVRGGPMAQESMWLVAELLRQRDALARLEAKLATLAVGGVDHAELAQAAFEGAQRAEKE